MVPSRWVVVCFVALAGACSTGDNAVDPGDLALRDLLGMSPDVAAGWSAAQRTAARHVLTAGLASTAPPSQLTIDPGPGAGPGAGLGAGPSSGAAPAAATAAGSAVRDPDSELDDRVVAALAVGDARRAADGAGPLGVVRAHSDLAALAVTPYPAPGSAGALAAGGDARPAGGPTELWLSSQWDAQPRWAQLPGRGLDVLTALAHDAGHTTGPILVVPAPRLTVIAAYVVHDAGAPPHLAVNPVLLAAIEPAADEPSPGRWSASDPPLGAAQARIAPPRSSVTGGNPYSFYGSFEECARAQRTRCETCVAGNTCSPVTDAASGTDECTALAANAGRGYFLLCINLSLAISSVDRCTGDAAPACARATGAADSLSTLDANADFLDTSGCAGALDACLAKIYGAPDEPFPGPDGGADPPEPPRSTNISCGHACDHDNANCDASPNVDCSGPSCNNSLSCDSGCSSSNSQSGCGGNCNSCSSDSGGNSSSGSCGSSSGSGSSSGCGGDSGCGGGSGSSGGGCGGGSGGGCGGGSGGGCGGGSGGGGKCSATPADPGPGVALVMSVMWGLLPVPFAAFTRRRARRRAARNHHAHDASGTIDMSATAAVADERGANDTAVSSASADARDAISADAEACEANDHMISAVADERGVTKVDPPVGDGATDDEGARS